MSKSYIQEILNKCKKKPVEPEPLIKKVNDTPIIPKKTPGEIEVKETITDEEYNKRLSKTQQLLKDRIVENHQSIEEENINHLVDELSRDKSNIIALFIADKDFNNLFIIVDVTRFIDLAEKMNFDLDFTYLYALKPNGSQYYGIDEYDGTITELFENIGKFLNENDAVTPAELKKIKGVNIFHNLYLDFGDADDAEDFDDDMF